jgi:hypothetical protein
MPAADGGHASGGAAAPRAVPVPRGSTGRRCAGSTGTVRISPEVLRSKPSARPSAVFTEEWTRSTCAGGNGSPAAMEPVSGSTDSACATSPVYRAYQVWWRGVVGAGTCLAHTAASCRGVPIGLDE